jgi:hypothetical protein
LTAPRASESPTAGKSGAATALGVIGIVVGFLFCPVIGVILGVVSITQAKRAGVPGTLGVAAIVASVLGVVMAGVILLTLRR